MLVDKATDLAALDAATDGLVGCLITTPHDNALSATTILQVREVRQQDVGAIANVVAIGRAEIGKVELSRHFTGEMFMLADEDQRVVDLDGKVEEVRSALMQYKEVSDRLIQEHHLEHRPLDEVTARMREELLAVDLDSAPATSLERLHGIWGVTTDDAIEEQLHSFAAFRLLTPAQRSMALGMTSTAERLDLAVRCITKTCQRSLAILAVQEAFA